MEVTPLSLLNVTEEVKKNIRDTMGLTEKRIQESLDAVQEWCSKQGHLKEPSTHLKRDMIEAIYIIVNGSTEQTKEKLEKFMTYRALIPEMCIQRTVEEFYPLLNILLNVPLPKLNKADNTRVMVMKFIAESSNDDFTLTKFCRYNSMMIDYRLHHDYVFAERYIIDFGSINVGAIANVTPSEVKKSQVFANLFGTKIKGMHILNAPWFMDRFMFLLKSAMKDKVAQRVIVHPTFEDLHQHVSKEILPSDYNGDEKSVAELAEDWREAFKQEQNRKMFENMDKVLSDESKRTNWKYNDEYLGVGIDGSFRKLDLD